MGRQKLERQNFMAVGKAYKDSSMSSAWALLRISYLENKTNDWVRSSTKSLVGPQEPLLAPVKRRKLEWFGHIIRYNSLSKTILQGTLEGGRRLGRQRKCWKDNIKEWTSLPMPELLTRASCRKDWRRISAESPTTQSVKGLNWIEQR